MKTRIYATPAVKGLNPLQPDISEMLASILCELDPDSIAIAVFFTAPVRDHVVKHAADIRRNFTNEKKWHGDMMEVCLDFIFALFTVLF